MASDIFMSIELDTTDARRLLARTPPAVERAARTALVDGGELLLEDMQEYPPELPNQEYERTFDLRRSWSRGQVEQQSSSLVLRVTSDPDQAPYNRFVQSDAYQARIHQGRWQTLGSVCQRRQSDIQQMFADRVRAEMHR